MDPCPGRGYTCRAVWRFSSYDPDVCVARRFARRGRLDTSAQIVIGTREMLLGRVAKGVGTVWYPSAPVFGVYLRVPSPIGASKRGFRSASLSIDIDVETLKQPGWQASIRRMWSRVSTLVQPFYGDVRTLHGFRRHRGRLFSARETMRHPVNSWWWPGIPPGPAHSIVLGERSPQSNRACCRRPGGRAVCG
jgi:hypothetical protein